MVRLNGVPNTALVGIGRFSDTALASSVSTTDAPTPDETAPPLATISTSVLGPVAEVTASSTPVSTGAGSGLRDFTQIDIDNGTKKRVVAGLHTSSLVSTLLAQTSLSTSILPGLPLISLVTNSILTPLVDTVVAGTLTPLLSQIFSALDPAINQLLAALGIQVGTLDMGVNGVSCGVPKLVG
ncbi:putative membrane protein [Parvibaculum indicum]|uniref:hypothetical protein n=1 Tax=Parvibaculum indicum TaxID=562969 RepID=UPI00141E5A32|nr:hypothetical protein [Parvibaculum indicum]NIJ42072.1 putative membrane protein [Parvibaculum indicum]